MHTAQQKNILVAPLDWGLGHTTRCVPIIKYLQANGHIVTAAGNEWQLAYLEHTFPSLPTLPLEGYNMHYSRHGSSFMLSMFSQVPKMLSTVKKEHHWLEEQATQHGFDGIISDNRYGLWHTTIPSVIITHQVQAQSGMGYLADRMVQKLHYRHLQRFGQCWIADVGGIPNLSGSLGHPSKLPVNSTYIGLLSQLEPVATTTEEHLLILLSGPEPQRSILSEILWQQVLHYSGKVVFIEGSGKVNPPAHIPSHISYHRQVTKDVLQPLLAKAAIVICRSGYSSLMDLVAMHKKAILVPTPGQTEQEYLGRYLHAAGIFLHMHQKNFDLQRALQDAHHFPYRNLSIDNAHNRYPGVLDTWLNSL